MSNYLTQIKEPAYCGTDYLAENPLVLQAVQGFSSYGVLFDASCLKDAEGDYCFADAITNASKAANTYPYYLPLGEALPQLNKIDCNDCVQRTMEIFANTTQDGDLLSKSYETAAQQIDAKCGASWVPLKAKASSGAITISHTNMAVMVTAFLAVLAMF
jgi:hypothetical protein